MWKVYSRCLHCKREIEVIQKGLDKQHYWFVAHYNEKLEVCEGSDAMLVTKFTRAEHPRLPKKD